MQHIKTTSGLVVIIKHGRIIKVFADPMTDVDPGSLLADERTIVVTDAKPEIIEISDVGSI